MIFNIVIISCFNSLSSESWDKFIKIFKLFKPINNIYFGVLLINCSNLFFLIFPWSVN